MLAGTVDIVHCESEQKTETGFSKSDAGQRVSSRDLRTDGSSVGRQETRLLASDLALLKSVQQKIVQTRNGLWTAGDWCTRLCQHQAHPHHRVVGEHGGKGHKCTTTRR